jgi:hypothetical protein
MPDPAAVTIGQLGKLALAVEGLQQSTAPQSELVWQILRRQSVLNRVPGYETLEAYAAVKLESPLDSKAMLEVIRRTSEALGCHPLDEVADLPVSEVVAALLSPQGKTDSPGGTTDPSSDSSTTPGTPPENMREAKGTTGTPTPPERAKSRNYRKRVPESRERAFNQYLAAVREIGDNATDWDAFNWFEAREDIERGLGFDTWSRYVREGRKAAGQSKNTPRKGRECRSAVDAKGKRRESGQKAD